MSTLEHQVVVYGQAALAALQQQTQEPRMTAQEPPAYETPAHEDVDLATVLPEDVGLDPDDMDSQLAKAIYGAHAKKTDPLRLVPFELKQKTNWVRWKLETVNGRLTKVPYQLNGNKASSTDRATWNTYNHIVSGATVNDTQGIGIMTDGSFVGFDLDGCRNPQTGEIKEWAQRVIDALGTYTEITPSGYGVRVYAVGQLPDGARRFSLAPSAGFGDKVGIECYSDRRYFTVTGNRVGAPSGCNPQILHRHINCAQTSAGSFRLTSAKLLRQIALMTAGLFKSNAVPEWC